MLNEERILLMTKMASYEANEGKKYKKLGTWFRGDYLSSQLLKAVLAATIAFAMVLGLYIFYDFENFMENIYEMDLIALAKKALTWYLAIVIGYAAVSYVVCTVRYSRARKSLRLSSQNLLNCSLRQARTSRNSPERKAGRKQCRPQNSLNRHSRSPLLTANRCKLSNRHSRLRLKNSQSQLLETTISSR